MTRWTPLSVYLTALCYTTAVVILAGTFAVQASSEWPIIRGTGHLLPNSHESSQKHGAVKPAPRFAHSSLVTGREWTPSRSTLRSDWGYEPRASDHGVSIETLVKSAAPLCGVRPALGWSIAMRESSGRHWDASGAVLRSSSGAMGVMQIKPSTARDVDPKLDVMQPWDNSIAGLCHFRRLLDKARGNVRLALRWYHRGEYARGPVPQATHDYATDIIEWSN